MNKSMCLPKGAIWSLLTYPYPPPGDFPISFSFGSYGAPKRNFLSIFGFQKIGRNPYWKAHSLWMRKKFENPQGENQDIEVRYNLHHLAHMSSHLWSLEVGLLVVYLTPRRQLTLCLYMYLHVYVKYFILPWSLFTLRHLIHAYSKGAKKIAANCFETQKNCFINNLNC